MQRKDTPKDTQLVIDIPSPKPQVERDLDLPSLERVNSSDSIVSGLNTPPPLLQALPPLRRKLSASYTDPVTGKPTNDDPSGYEGEERRIREDALLRDLPDTGYASGIRSRRMAKIKIESGLSFSEEKENTAPDYISEFISAMGGCCDLMSSSFYSFFNYKDSEQSLKEDPEAKPQTVEKKSP